MSKKIDQKKLLEEYAKRAKLVKSLDWDALMFQQQREFIEDPSRLKVAVCTRRAGKSHGIALAMLKKAYEFPGSFPIYMNANRASAKMIIWPALREIDKQLNLGLRFDEATSNIKVPNGSNILVFGVGSRREMEKIRGGKPPIACLDEAQHMGSDMAYLLTEIVLPSLMDYKAQLLITGTPNASCSGPFHDIAHGGSISKQSSLEWAVHKWGMEDNPFIRDVEEEYAIACAAAGWTTSSPGFRREYMGEWVRDTEGLCYEMNKSVLVDSFPRGDTDDWRFILGVDLGTKDPCGFTTLATSRKLGVTYCVESYRDEFSTLQAGTEIERLREVYNYSGPIIVDSGGQGAAFVKQWKDTHPTLPIQPVKKGYGSVDMGVNIINADMRAGKFFIVEPTCQQLIDELNVLIWDHKMSPTGARRIKRGDAYPDHCADSMRYAFTQVRTWGTKGFEYNDTLEKDSAAYVERAAAARKAKILSGPEDSPEPFWKTLVQKV